MEVMGLYYPAIIVQNMEQSIEFYTKLGMRHLYTEPNRDDPESLQALLHAGAETFLLLVGPRDSNMKLAEASLGVGSMQYLSLHVTSAFMDQAFFELSSAGRQASEEIRRGYERLVFMEDPNGVLVTLIAWTTDPPAGVSRPAVLERAAAIRDAQRLPFIEESHLQQAIAELAGT
jgi:catechol 2,3-dioxygenase-like lactoylglutathione lyase family enzyme